MVLELLRKRRKEERGRKKKREGEEKEERKREEEGDFKVLLPVRSSPVLWKCSHFVFPPAFPSLQLLA
jgi:hypothetical protein